jgi:hypothetical protein
MGGKLLNDLNLCQGALDGKRSATDPWVSSKHNSWKKRNNPVSIFATY